MNTLRRKPQTERVPRSLIRMKITTPLSLSLLFGILMLADSAPAQDVAPPEGMRILGTASFQTPTEIQSLAFSSDSRRLAVGPSQDGVLVWDLETAKEVDRIAAKTGIAHVQYLSDGRRMVVLTMMTAGARFDQNAGGTI